MLLSQLPTTPPHGPPPPAPPSSSGASGLGVARHASSLTSVPLPDGSSSSRSNSGSCGSGETASLDDNNNSNNSSTSSAGVANVYSPTDSPCRSKRSFKSPPQSPEKSPTTKTNTKKKKKKKTCATAGKCLHSCAAYGKVCSLMAESASRAASFKIGLLLEDSALFGDDCVASSSGASRSHNVKSCKHNKKNSNDGHDHDSPEGSESSEITSNYTGTQSNEFACFPSVAAVDPTDIVMGEMLGEGGFCNVYACALKVKKQEQQQQEEDEKKTVEEVAIGLDETCAIKYLKIQITTHRKSFQHGAADLATEAFFLARLGDDHGHQHPNIVQLKAVAAGSVAENVKGMATTKFASSFNLDFDGSNDDDDDDDNDNQTKIPSPTGFFIVIERLVETLEQRIKRWQAQVVADQNSHSHGFFYRMSKEYKDKQRAWLKERVHVAAEIASVMAYVHSRGVAFRDLKPDNIGFDRHGTLKLFDLGLCKEEKPSLAYDGDEDENDGNCDVAKKRRTYRMTGHTGSRRYMAPEVALDQGYDKSVDVYSFGILLWEICTLEKPFKGYCSKKHLTNVIQGDERPKMDHHHTALWPVNLQWLIKSCWSREPEDRPSFNIANATLVEVQDELSAMKAVGSRARSTGSHDDTTSGGSNNKTSHSPVFAAIKKPPRQGGLRVRSLGLKRGNS